ncbi:VPLPA-CTERM sorting domain-containing protein [Pseudomonadales bacterium]|nr:VPLPA-CTERM sorting domain-containing protein [Pseudomonadales bacterium]
MKIKNLATATLALSMSASSLAAFTLVENGDFSNGLDGFGNYAEPGVASVSDGGGYGLVNGGGGWGGGFVYKDEAPSLASMGLNAGDTYTFQFDMISGEAGTTGIKVESWANGAALDNSGEIDFNGNGADWVTYTYDYTINAAADSFKIVLVGNSGGSTSFDNVGIDVPTTAVPVPAAAWLFGSALAGLVAVRRNK